MKPHVKAVLLSALVLPGMGQLSRGRVLKGGILLLLVTLLLLAALFLAALLVQDVLQAVRLHGRGNSVAIAGQIRHWLPCLLAWGGAFFLVWAYGVVDALLDRDPPSGADPAAPFP